MKDTLSGRAGFRSTERLEMVRSEKLLEIMAVPLKKPFPFPALRWYPRKELLPGGNKTGTLWDPVAIAKSSRIIGKSIQDRVIER